MEIDDCHVDDKKLPTKTRDRPQLSNLNIMNVLPDATLTKVTACSVKVRVLCLQSVVLQCIVLCNKASGQPLKLPFTSIYKY